MNGKFPCFSSDVFLDLSFQVLLFRLETLNLELVKWFCFFTEIKTHTSVDENLSIFRNKFEWKFFHILQWSDMVAFSYWNRIDEIQRDRLFMSYTWL